MFVYNGNISKLIKATELANKLYNNEHFYLEIENKDAFDMSTVSGFYISGKIKESENMTINVKTYRSRNPWSSALGYFTSSRPTDINLNTRRLNRSVESIVATFWHEKIHMLDNFDLKQSYGHGSNNPTGKQNTAPFWVDNLAQTLSGGMPNFNDTSNANYSKKRTTISRIWRAISRIF